MRYIKLLSSVLALCLMLTANAYATGADASSTTEDIPAWALKPALEPGEVLHLLISLGEHLFDMLQLLASGALHHDIKDQLF